MQDAVSSQTGVQMPSWMPSQAPEQPSVANNGAYNSVRVLPAKAAPAAKA